MYSDYDMGVATPWPKGAMAPPPYNLVKKII